MKDRLISLDAFRGLTIIAMIVVNTPGSWSYVYPPLRHAEWNGLTPTDLVFPFFLFIVGVSIVLALNKSKRNNQNTYKPLIKKIVKRSLLLFAIGIILNLMGSNFEYLRLPGVLQRIALVYFPCAIIFLYTSVRQQLFIAVFILIGYNLAMTLIHIPGSDTTELLPVVNIATWIDGQIIPFHLYQKTWDPEGILSTLPAIVTGMLGVITGHQIISSYSTKIKIRNILIAGIILLIIGEIWSWFFPVNKNMWTSSYVLYTGGLASITLSLLMWLIDEKGIKRWAVPSIEFGSNAITAYILSNIVTIPFSISLINSKSIQVMFMSLLINSGISPEFSSLLWALLIVIICYLPVMFMYRKRIFLKI